MTVFLLGRAAGLLLIACLHTYWFLQPVPTTFKTVAALFVVLSLVRPAWGLIAFAAIAPISTVFANFCGAPGMGAPFLEQVALAIGAGVLLRSGASEGRTRIGAPALFMAVVAVASAATQLLAATTLPALPGVSGRLVINEIWNRQVAQSSPLWAPLFAAHAVVACAWMGWGAERIVRRSPHLATWLVAIGLLGHAVAAGLNVKVVVDAAMRTASPLTALPQLFMTIRSSVQTDWNAGASALLLAGVSGFGLMAGSRTRRVGVTVLLLIVAAGLWATSSRAAIIMAVVTGVAAIGWSLWSAMRRGRREYLAVISVVVLALAAGFWLAVHYPSGRNDIPSRTISSRLVLMKAGLQMFERAPLFGIGITRFYAASADVVGPTLAGLGAVPHENAHNNFVQVLAEQGLVGLGALLWWLAVVVWAGTRAQMAKPTAIRGALLVGIAACVGTWLTGHPLLVLEFAVVFWFYCGILAGTTHTAVAARRPWVPAVLAIGVLLSVPLRAQGLRNDAYLEHLGVGLSMWQHDDLQRYREAGTAFAIYLQAGDRPVGVPIRRAPGAPDLLVVEIRIRGQLIDSVLVGGEGWQTILVPVPQGSRRFELVEFTVRPQASGQPVPEVLVRVGRTAVR